MKMDRNENPDGKGKYALLQLRKILTADDGSHPPEVVAAIDEFRGQQREDHKR